VASGGRYQMKRDAAGPCLSAVFVDYDNIYLSLKRKSEEAARRLAKDAASWVREIESGRLITPTNSLFAETKRRIVMNRCYGNPVPRRNSHDNSTDMNSFPFVRHHFLRAGFEVIDCPPLTAQLKNSADIRMVMDVRDYLTHETYFDEFIILSGDADFTPVLHRLRAHARRTIIFANDYTATPYTAISDGEVRESDLVALLLDGRLPTTQEGAEAAVIMTASAHNDSARSEIIDEIVAGVRAAAAPVPLEALADRALRALGHDKTIGTSWGGAGSFRELLRQSLPAEIQLTGEPPYYAFDIKRHGQHEAATPVKETALSAESFEAPALTYANSGAPPQTAAQTMPATPQIQRPTATGATAPAQTPSHTEGERLLTERAGLSPQNATSSAVALTDRPPPAAASLPAPATSMPTSTVQQAIARIHDACQAPPLAPPEYRLLFEVMAEEINENGLSGAPTLANIAQRAQQRGLEARRDDIRFVLEVVSEADPWFEQGASANLFAGRFRNFVVARCRGQGLSLSVDELDLIDAWFAGGSMPQLAPTRAQAAQPLVAPPATANRPQVPTQATLAQPTPPQTTASSGRSARWWSLDEGREHIANQRQLNQTESEDEFPRIVRTRLRG
jgi:NYN domain